MESLRNPSSEGEAPVRPDDGGDVEPHGFRARWSARGQIVERGVFISPTECADDVLADWEVKHPESFCRIDVPTLGVVVFVECPWKRGELDFTPPYLARLEAFDRAFDAMMDDAQILDGEGRNDG